jgi:hypothetical protein
MKPHVICHMMISLDGRIHPSRWTESPDGDRRDWTTVYEDVHGQLGGEAWLVGRVTMAEMSKGTPHPPAHHDAVMRPHHFARRDAGTYAMAFDRLGKLHFDKADEEMDPKALFPFRRPRPTATAALLARPGSTLKMYAERFGVSVDDIR